MLHVSHIKLTDALCPSPLCFIYHGVLWITEPKVGRIVSTEGLKKDKVAAEIALNEL